MKVACEACGARYAIPDTKIRGAGRTFKVTCRQCSGAIMIKGIADDAESPAWYFAVGQDRQGPVDANTIAAHLADGTLAGDSLIWRQGMSGWEPLASVEALKEILTPTTDTPEIEPELSLEDDEADNTMLVSRSELDAAHAALDAGEADEPTPAEAEPSAPSTDSMLAALFDGDTPLDESTPMHERHDTSVLFSLDDLSKVGGAEALGVATGGGDQGESSGLIDLRGAKTRSGNRRKALTQSPFDDGPTTSSGPETGVKTIAVPVIKRRSNTGPIIVGLVAICAGAAFAYYQLKGGEVTTAAKPQTVAAAPSKSKPPAKPAAPAASKTPTPATNTQAPVKAVVAAKQPEAAAAEAKPEAAGSDGGEERPMTAAERRRQRRLERRERLRQEREARREGGGSGSKKAPTATSTPKPQPTKVEAPKPQPTKVEAPKPEAKKIVAPGAPNKDVNALLAALNKNKGGDSGAAVRGDTAGLPQRLSSSKLRSTLRKKRGSFAACYQKMAEKPAGSVTVNTSLVVAGSGKVKSVRITSGGGASAGVLRCITSALRSTKFPRFGAAQMPVNYPIVLR